MPKSRRPYLIRAIHEWACDNGYTPHLLIAADYPGVVVPRQYVQDGRITARGTHAELSARLLDYGEAVRRERVAAVQQEQA